MTNVQGDQAPENVEKIENASMKTIAEQSIGSQTPLGSVIEFARP
jgi:hypothetical protein